MPGTRCSWRTAPRPATRTPGTTRYSSSARPRSAPPARAAGTCSLRPRAARSSTRLAAPPRAVRSGRLPLDRRSPTARVTSLWLRARRGLRPEPDPVLLVIDAHVHDLVQVDRNRAVLGGQVVPAV